MTTDPGTCQRALVVEDDPAIRRLVEKLLQRRGILIDTAHDGKEALNRLRDGNYSVVVLDLMLPEANGYDIISYIKSNRPGIPVVVVSAVSQQALAQLDMEVVKMVISKPFDVHDFTDKITAICAARPSQA